MTNQMNRQYPMTAVFTFTKDDFGAGTDLILGYLPDNSIITQSFVETTEAFDASTIDIAATNSTLAVPQTLANAVARADATALGITTARSEVKVTRGATTDTTGKGVLIVAYVQAGRANEVQP